MGRTRSRGRKHPRRRNCSAACCLLPFTPLLGYWYWYYRGPHRHHRLQQRLRGITEHSHRNTSVLFEQDHRWRRKPFAVATLLTTAPSAKNDGWTPRSVGKKEQGDIMSVYTIMNRKVVLNGANLPVAAAMEVEVEQI